jgi:hypothetical protein
MVDLVRTEEQLLAEIQGAGERNALETAAADPPIRVVGRTQAELLPVLAKTFSTRYSHLPPDHVNRDLIDLVKKGLGNAYKWGNERDPDKLLVVTALMTHTGALIKITDQGNGFDVPHVVKDRIFTHGGSGLTRFHKTTSVISYADGGRTLLIRFLCHPEPETIAADRRTETAPRAASTSCRIGLVDLSPGDQVKVKGVLDPQGVFLARKVFLKPFEELAVIEAALQQVLDHGRAIRLLNLNVRLSEQTQITDNELTPAGFDQLRAGQVASVIGSYVPDESLVPFRIKIRRGPNGQTSEVQGRIEAINHADRTFRVVGITVAMDGQTEVMDSRETP